MVRGESLEASMSDFLIQDIKRLANIDIRIQCEAIEGIGQTRLEKVAIRNRTDGETDILPVAAFFVMIGALPHTDWLSSCVQRDEKGFILTGTSIRTEAARLPLRFETSMPGVFAAGDVRHASVKRVASAVGEGSIALQFIHDYLADPVTVS